MIRLRWLALGVLALPFVEFAAFWWVAGRVGFLGALIGVVATSFAGILLLKGGARLLFAQLVAGRVVVLSDDAARSGLLTALAGLLLAIPGFVTDVIALLLLLPALKSLFLGARAVSTSHGRTPTPPGVVDLEPQDWRDDSRRPEPPGNTRIGRS
jgi:UPF0716 protein FxsA